MALVVLGLFVLVWIISAVVKASQDNGPRRRPEGRPRPFDDRPRAERTSSSDIDRFMAEIDRLRRKGEGLPAGGRAGEPRPAPRPIIERPRSLEPRPRPQEPRRERERDRDRDRERRVRQAPRPAPTPTPPPLTRTESVPILRPVAPERPAPPPAAPPKPARPAKPAAVGAPPPVSPVAKTLQSVLRSPQGPAAALILAEVFGEPRARRPMRARGG
jgi:hypothetical protein